MLFLIINSITSNDKWHTRIVKDILDIRLLYKFVGLDKTSWRIAYEQIENREITVIKKEQFPEVLNIVDDKLEFQENLLKIIEKTHSQVMTLIVKDTWIVSIIND